MLPRSRRPAKDPNRSGDRPHGWRDWIAMTKQSQTPAIVQAVLLFGSLCLIFGWSAVFILPFALWILPIIVAISLGLSRGRTGWLWGALLGWLGVLILACMR